MDRPSWAVELLDRMRQRGLSQADVARLAGMTTKHVSQTLQGKGGANLANINRIANAVGDEAVVTFRRRRRAKPGAVAD